MKSIKITTVGGLYKTIISWQKAILLGIVAIAIVGCNDGKSSFSNKNTKTYANATSEIKVICDRDGESVYLNNQFKSTCDNGDPVPMKAQAGKYTVEVKKDNGNGSYYYYKKSFRIGNGVEKIVEANSNIHYTEKYYYIKAKKSKKVKDYWTYLKKYPHGKYVTIAKNYLDGYYWKRCNSIDGCKAYLSKIPWGIHRTKAKEKLKTLYYQETNRIFYDKDTGLTWQDNKAVKTIERTWSDAKAYCKNLTLHGYSDWRLPNIKELDTIVDTDNSPAIKNGFKNVTSFYYWSSSQDVSGSSIAWEVYFGYGGAYDYDGSVKGYVRCVRGRQKH